MGDSKLLGCWGVIVGLFAAVVLGWMTVELLLGALGSFGTDGMAALADVLIWREAGQLLVVGTAVIGIYVAVFRPTALRGLLPVARVLLWIGAVLCLLTWVRLPSGARGATWSLLLGLLGILVPFLLARMTNPDR